MKLNRIAMAALLAAPLAIPAHALVTVTPLLGFYKADEPQGVTIDDGLFAGLSAGLQFFPSWSFEAEYGKSGDTKLLSGNVLVYPSSWSFGRVSPYILAGVSQSKLDYKAGGFKGDSTDTDLGLGYGLLYSLSNNLAVRGELRVLHNNDHSLTNYLALAGLQYNFGLPQVEAPVVQSEPAKPQVVVPPVDTDGDGVVDANDRCPNTPAGWEVGTDGCPLDSDKDKVPNSIDACPNTPLGQPVGANGCPMDDDKDGVPNNVDKCPNTKQNVVVDEKGCDKVVTQKVEQQINIVFDSGKAVIKPEFKAEVAKIADLAKQYPAAFISIEGHTDASGKPASNTVLSQQRADAVRMMLIKDFGVAADRLTAKGFGSSQPVADNNTAEGKAKNRRVIAVLTGERQVVVTKPAEAKKAVKAKKGKKGGKVKAKAKK